MRSVTLSDELTLQLRDLPNDALECVVAEAWRARDRIEAAGFGSPRGCSAVNLLGDLLGHLDDELERRDRIFVAARIDVEWNGHLVGYGGAEDVCTCGWRAGLGDGWKERCAEHAEANGGRSLFGPDGLDYDLLDELHPEIPRPAS